MKKTALVFTIILFSQTAFGLFSENCPEGVSVVSETGINKIFQEIVKIKGLSYQTPEDLRCGERSREIQYSLSNYAHPLRTKEVVLQVTETCYGAGQTCETDTLLNVYSDVTRRWYNDWIVHIAPVICVQTKTQGRKLYVLDPSLFKGPARLSAWEDRVTEGISQDLYEVSIK